MIEVFFLFSKHRLVLYISIYNIQILRCVYLQYEADCMNFERKKRLKQSILHVYSSKNFYDYLKKNFVCYTSYVIFFYAKKITRKTFVIISYIEDQRENERFFAYACLDKKKKKIIINMIKRN